MQSATHHLIFRRGARLITGSARADFSFNKQIVSTQVVSEPETCLQPFETVASLEKEVPMQNMFASKPIRRPALKALSTLFSLGTACRHGSALAGEPSPVVSSRLRNFLRWQIR